MSNRTLIIIFYALALVMLVLGLVFAFGAPQSAEDVPMDRESDAGEVQNGEPADQEASVADSTSPFAIEIPGCVCHSDDPVVVMEHSQYRMNQCFGCHAEGVPEMGQ